MTHLLLLFLVMPAWLAVLVLAIPVWLYVLYCWSCWWLPYAVLAAVRLLERPEPEPVTYSVLGKPARDLTVADVRWGDTRWPAVWVDLV